MVDEALEGLEQSFNYNAMVSHRGVLNLYHYRRACATPSRGAVIPCPARPSMPNCSTATGAGHVPFLDYDNARFPIPWRTVAAAGGTARHDAVVWGYARGADTRGVDIIENCEVTGFA